MAGSEEATNEMSANSDLDEDGLHGGRMRPLSSLGIPAKKASTLSAKFAPSQVFAAAISGTKARYRSSLYGNGKRNAIMRIQRMRVRSKNCKDINHKGTRHGGIEEKSTALAVLIEGIPNLQSRTEQLKLYKDKDLDSASNVTCKDLEASTKVFDNIISSSRKTALSCFQEQKCLDFTLPREDPSVHDESVPDAQMRLAAEVHLNLAESGEEKKPLFTAGLLEERISGEVPLTERDNTVNPLPMKSCIDPILENAYMSIVKTEDETEFVVADAATCNSMHVTKGYCEAIKTSRLKLEGNKCFESFKAEPELPFQAVDKHRHGFGAKYSRATCLGSDSVDSLRVIKDIKVENSALETFLTTNSKMIKSQQFMGKRGASPQVSENLDVLKQIRELNPGIINKLRDKSQVHAALGAIIGASSANSLGRKDQQSICDYKNQGLEFESEGRPAKRRNNNDYRMRPAQMNSLATADGTALLVDAKKQATDMDATTQASCEMAEAGTTEVYSTEYHSINSYEHHDVDAGVNKNPSLQASDVILRNLSLQNDFDLSRSAKQQKDSGTNCLCDQSIPCQERSHALLQVANKTTANVASCWLELLRLDIKGCLSALKRSRRRIQSVIASGQLEDKMNCADDTFQKSSRWDKAAGGNRDSQTVEVDKWRVFFLHMDGVLHLEGARLENWLSQINQMQSHCEKSTPSCLPSFDRK